MRIVSAQEMYSIDSFTAEQIGINDVTLMENAGQSVTRKIIKRIHTHQKIAVLAGAGNNGGDGFVIARVLKGLGYQVDLWLILPLEKVKGAAKHALEVYTRSGYDVHYFIQNEDTFFTELSTYEIIIDCLIGIGVKGSLRSPYEEIIKKVNDSMFSQIISVDVPSGVPANGGEVKLAIHADTTITIQYPKVGAFTYPSASFYGEMLVADIGIPPIAVNHCTQKRMVWTESVVKKHLPQRAPNTHKGTNGKGIIIGGSEPMTGAVMLSAKAALKSGAGLLTVMVPGVIHPIVASHFLEAMYLPCPTENGYFQGEMPVDLEPFDAIAIGPGMGRTKGGQKIVEQVLKQNIPVALDADALYHLKELLPLLKNRTAPTVLTPHSGEMARLRGSSIQEIESQRFAVSEEFATEYGIYLVLKGPYTIVTTPNGEQYVNPTGNSALSKGGTGDVLTGIILGFLMQHHHIQAAISNAVYIHGKCANLLIEQEHTLLDVLASDIIDHIPKALNTLK